MRGTEAEGAKGTRGCAPSPPLLELRDLTAGYRLARGERRTVVRDLAMSLEEGALTALVGRNGAGKSTLLRTLARLQPPLEGEVLFRGEPVGSMAPDRFARSVSLVLSERNAPANLTVRELVALGRYPFTDWRGRLGEGDFRVVESALRTMELIDLAERRAAELSDGERQRVFVARALAQEPELLLLDEPTAFSDLLHKAEILRILRDYCRSRGATVLLILHDIAVATRFADRLWLLSEGKITQGIPEDLLLSGELERLFSSPKLRYDPLRGTYASPEEIPTGIVGLSGRGRARDCAALALERWGFGIDSFSGGGILSVEVRGEGSDARFALRRPGGGAETFRTLEELRPALEAAGPAVSSVLPGPDEGDVSPERPLLRAEGS
jgi:iron complex transport system ATP-binding protein